MAPPMVQLYHNRNVNKNSLLFKVDYTSIINQLVDLKVIVQDPTMIKKGYRYQKIYDVFVGTYGGVEDEH